MYAMAEGSCTQQWNHLVVERCGRVVPERRVQLWINPMFFFFQKIRNIQPHTWRYKDIVDKELGGYLPKDVEKAKKRRTAELNSQIASLQVRRQKMSFHISH